MSQGQPYVGTHPPDEDLVRRLIAAQFPRWSGLSVRRFPSGGTVNAVHRLGEDLLVRLPLAEGGAGDVLREQEWLPRLGPLLPARIPEVLGAGEPTGEYPWPWSVQRWLVGEHPDSGALNEPVLLAKDLAEFVAAMRCVGLPGAPGAYRGGPLSSLDPATRAALAELRCARSRRRAWTATPWRRCGTKRWGHRPGARPLSGCTPI